MSSEHMHTEGSPGTRSQALDSALLSSLEICQPKAPDPINLVTMAAVSHSQSCTPSFGISGQSSYLLKLLTIRGSTYRTASSKFKYLYEPWKDERHSFGTPHDGCSGMTSVVHHSSRFPPGTGTPQGRPTHHTTRWKRPSAAASGVTDAK